MTQYWFPFILSNCGGDSLFWSIASKWTCAQIGKKKILRAAVAGFFMSIAGFGISHWLRFNSRSFSSFIDLGTQRLELRSRQQIRLHFLSEKAPDLFQNENSSGLIPSPKNKSSQSGKKPKNKLNLPNNE